MNYLLDTNVISEPLRSKPNANVERWLKAVPDERLCVSVLTLGEIRKGIERLGEGSRKARLERWLEDELTQRFEGRLFAVDLRVSETWGRMLAKHGRPAPTIDSLLAATALAQDCAVLTRNTANFAFEGLSVINPFTAPPPA